MDTVRDTMLGFFLGGTLGWKILNFLISGSCHSKGISI